MFHLCGSALTSRKGGEKMWEVKVVFRIMWYTVYTVLQLQKAWQVNPYRPQQCFNLLPSSTFPQRFAKNPSKIGIYWIYCICCVNIVYMGLETQVAQLNSQRSPVLRPAERWLRSRSHLRGFKKSLLRIASLRDFHRPPSSSPLRGGDAGKQRLDTIGTWLGLVQFNIPLMIFDVILFYGYPWPKKLKPLKGLTTSYDDFSSPTWDNIESEVLHGFRLSILL